MKKLILFCVLFITSSAFSQFTQTNEPGVNQSLTLYVIDNTAPNYEATTGTGVTWDYSGVAGVDGQTQTAATLSMDNTDYEATYPSADYALTVGGRVTNFYESTVANRISHGLVFVEPNLGPVIARFTIDQAIEYDYPMDFGDVINDDFSGVVEFQGSVFDCEGDLTAEVDGRGTVKLANGIDLMNVLRYKITRNLMIKNAPFLGDINLKVIQYDYYDFTISNFPVFVHSYVQFIQDGATTPIFEETNVLSIEDPGELSLTDFSGSKVQDIAIYPNPTSDKLYINMPTVKDKAEVIIYDAMGKEVHRQALLKTQTSIGVADYRKGVYLVRVVTGDLVETKRIVIK